MRRLTLLFVAVVTAASGLSLVPATPAAAAGAISTAHDKIVSADPVDWTPNIQDGQVNAIVQVGNEIIVGGQFLQAKNIGGNLLDVSNILAFDATTGTINTGFMPTFDGEILTLGTDGSSVYVGGAFTTVNGQTGFKRLVKLNPGNGQIVTTFKAKIGSGAAVHDMSFANGKLYIGGAFSAIQGQTREKLAALDPVDGNLDPSLAVAFTGRHNGGTGRIRKFDITPDGTKLIAVGNFTLVDGQDRDQAAMVNLSTNTLANWETNRFKSACSSFFDTYTNDVDFSPDGSYFVIGTTGAFFGGVNAGVLCDTASRWETGATGTGLQPTWVDYTGGDTTFSVTTTGTAVYVGGHQRWWNNPYSPGGDQAGPGSVDRMGIAALDPVNGLPLSWNPVRDPRGLGVQMMLATPAGLWVGSDTSGIGGEYHGKIAFMPLAGGKAVPAPYVASLPNDLWTVPNGCLSQDNSVLYRVNAGGALVPSGNCQIDWAVDTTASPSPLHNTGSNAIAGGSVTYDPSVPVGTPSGIFSAAREDPSGGNEMQWNFPVTAGKQVKVRLYFANQSGSTKQPGKRVFNVSIDGTTVLPNFDIITAFGHQIGGMKEFTITSDGQVNVLFSHVVNNPLVNAIEIVDPSVPPGGGGGGPEYLARRSFDGAATEAATQLSTPGTDWSHARGAFVTGGKLYTGWDNGTFTSRSFDGASLGPATTIDLHGLTTSYWPVANVTGMFFTNGRIYYTVSGDTRLFYRYFTPESDVVGTQTFVASGSGDGLNWSAISGMTLAQNGIYFGRTNGNLYRMSFANGVPTPGTETLLSGPATGDGKDWKSRGMFIFGQTSDTFAPTKPGKPSGTSNDTSSIDLTWAASSDNVSSSLTYRVYRDGAQVGQVTSSSTNTVSYTDTPLGAGSVHTYTVDAVDISNNASAQSNASDPITVQTPDTTPPTVPGAPTATAGGKTRVDLIWPASTDDRGGQITYGVYRDGVSVGQVTSGSNTTVGFTDTGLSPATTYTYTVDATDVSNNTSVQTPPSNPVTTAGVIFSDGFDSGDFSAWTSSTRFTIDATTGGAAPPSALASPTAQSAVLTKDLGADYGSICVSESVKLTTQNGAALDLFRLRTAANGGIAKVFLSAAGNLQVKSDFSGTTKGSGVALPSGWNNVELCGTVGTTSVWDLYLNDVKIVNAWVADTGTTGVERVTVGDNTGKTFTINVDDVIVDAFPG
jgi:hypothetical protein